ncbi:polysaccharide deacetylase family protein [Tardiphaga sp. P9-11]|jgi:peptidoglycan/xylan/chitin deacetylase (PgdA/CDA1 family)|uniref:polysaccharide deacetylase family protein n=1 Tax=Tardiphaga sp. P9-11 TaxID=2024614 RepID=UPI0011F177B4|nr:polysaccharide deacetylase family protein [Tardiphaga sp. P9-11]KAA0077582.1 polysaccharide deacetylase [Tardiphaga sp. P9-11]
MKQIRNTIIRAGLDALYFSGAHRVLRPIFGGVGTIFMLHHVRPAHAGLFQPNRHLEITPDFLRATLAYLRATDVDIVTPDEVRRRLTEHDVSRRFACFTCDDGYRDNRDHALPAMRDFDAPFTVYVTSDFASGTGRVWWVALERVVAKANVIEAPIDGQMVRMDTSTLAGKDMAFDRLHEWLRGLPEEANIRREVNALCVANGIDEDVISSELCMSWDELKPFAADPLVTIGAHTVSHCNLAKQTEAMVVHELSASRTDIENVLQRPAVHLAYPYGDRCAAGTREFALAKSAGFETAVTTRPGVIASENSSQLTALPRVSLNGNYQDTRYLPVLTSGAATAMWNGFQRGGVG